MTNSIVTRSGFASSTFSKRAGLSLPVSPRYGCFSGSSHWRLLEPPALMFCTSIFACGNRSRSPDVKRSTYRHSGFEALPPAVTESPRQTMVTGWPAASLARVFGMRPGVLAVTACAGVSVMG